MRLLQIMFFCAGLVASVAWADGGQAPAEATSAIKAVGMSLNRVRHQQSRSQDEVKRLERDVTREQSYSEQASKRLQQQDEAIAELQKQLIELSATAPVGRH
jgi:septal ring factor EnvC (AmiA/AmiB activator)